MEFRKNLPFKSYGVEKPIANELELTVSRFRAVSGPTKQLVGRMLLQRLATGATGVKQARYRPRPTRGSEAPVRACAVYMYTTLVMYIHVCARPAYEFRRHVLHFSAVHL